MMVPGHAEWREPGAHRHSMAWSAERSLAICATIAVHLAVGMLLLQRLTGEDVMTPQTSPSHGLSIFSVMDTSATGDADPSELLPRRVVADTAPRPRTIVKRTTPATATIPTATPTIARQGKQILDPFAVAGLPNPKAGSDSFSTVMPVVRSTVPDLDVQVLLVVIQQVRQRFPDRNGTAILRCQISTDGRIVEAVFLGGSLGQESGAVLAEMLVGQPLYPETAIEGMRTALVGPFNIPLAAEETS